MTTTMMTTASTTGTLSLPTNATGTRSDDLDGATTSAIQIATAVILALIMFGLGCSVKIKVAWMYCKRPKQFIVGLALQLIVMPLLGLALTKMVQTTQAESVGVLIQASCPGGAYSNIVAYWIDGDMDLSIVMTTSSTILALGTMPFWLFVLPKIAMINDELLVPFDQLGYALLGIVVPVVAGSFVKWKLPKKSEYITKVCSIVGSIAILAMVIVLASVKKLDYIISWRLIIIVLLLPAVALIFGYLATLVPWLKFSVAARRTIAIETAMQSSAVGTSIVIRSFDVNSPHFNDIFFFPAMYAAVQLFVSFFGIVVFVILKRKGVKCVQATSTYQTEIQPTLSSNGCVNGAFKNDTEETEQEDQETPSLDVRL